MYYINAAPDATGNHGNPVSNRRVGMLGLPDTLLATYIGAKGFVELTTIDGTVSAVEPNTEALEAYNADHPETPPAPARDLEATIINTLIDQEIRLSTLEHGL